MGGFIYLQQTAYAIHPCHALVLLQYQLFVPNIGTLLAPGANPEQPHEIIFLSAAQVAIAIPAFQVSTETCVQSF